MLKLKSEKPARSIVADFQSAKRVNFAWRNIVETKPTIFLVAYKCKIGFGTDLECGKLEKRLS